MVCSASRYPISRCPTHTGRATDCVSSFSTVRWSSFSTCSTEPPADFASFASFANAIPNTSVPASRSLGSMPTRSRVIGPGPSACVSPSRYSPIPSAMPPRRSGACGVWESEPGRSSSSVAARCWRTARAWSPQSGIGSGSAATPPKCSRRRWPSAGSTPHSEGEPAAARSRRCARRPATLPGGRGRSSGTGPRDHRPGLGDHVRPPALRGAGVRER